jgi:hypothetical protein
MKHSIAVLACISFLSGCASTVKVTYYSDPPLATIYQGSQRVGVAPVALTYQISDAQKQAGHASFRGVTARWVSGATAEISSMNIDLSNGRDQNYTFFRPQSYPGLEMDLQHVSNFRRDLMNLAPALVREQQQQQQQQQRPIVPSYTPPPTYNTNCTRDYLGNVNCITR